MVEDDDDGPCTNCWGSGYDGNREARCHCLPPLPKAPMVEVTQADERAAKAIMVEAGNEMYEAMEYARSDKAAIALMAQIIATHRTEAVAALEARVRELEGFLQPFAFLEMEKDEGLADTQYVWETIYSDRVRDWFSYEDIDAARKALHDPR